MIRACGFALAALALAACGQTFAEKQAEALAAEPTITPGVFGNVRADGEAGDRRGLELRLPEGSDSGAIRMVICEGACSTGSEVPVTRGLGGVAFAIPHAGRLVDVTVQPDGPDAVVVNADWGRGLEQQRLPRLPQPAVLDQATGG